jgi:hypothetical protein
MTKILRLASLFLALTICGCELGDRIPPELVSISRSQPLGNEKSLDATVRFDIGTLEVSAAAAPNLYSMDLDYDKAHFDQEVRFDSAGSDAGRLNVKLESSRKGNRVETKNNRMRLDFTDAVPLKLTVSTGLGKARLSLSRLKLANLDLEGGVGHTEISSYDPNTVECDRVRIRNGVGGMQAVGLGNLNFRTLEFEGGVGGANLDFTGEWKNDAEIRIEVGVGGVSVKMPRAIGVEVNAEKHFLSGLHLDGFSKRNSRYYSENYDTAKIRVTIKVSTGIGGFRINWV